MHVLWFSIRLNTTRMSSTLLNGYRYVPYGIIVYELIRFICDALYQKIVCTMYSVVRWAANYL